MHWAKIVIIAGKWNPRGGEYLIDPQHPFITVGGIGPRKDMVGVANRVWVGTKIFGDLVVVHPWILAYPDDREIAVIVRVRDNVRLA
ncbi:MAG: hypothetical protein EBZ61_10985 [Micrococcales bacterium]|nr:hypothetical protein [Micrococcales bacterium]